MASKEIVEAQDKGGRWVAGKSGNPKGRPLSRKDKINESKQKLEEFIRGRVDPKRIANVINTLVEAAEEGDMKAAAAILPYFLTKAAEGSDNDKHEQRPAVVFRIENATLTKERKVIAVDAEVISDG